MIVSLREYANRRTKERSEIWLNCLVYFSVMRSNMTTPWFGVLISTPYSSELDFRLALIALEARQRVDSHSSG